MRKTLLPLLAAAGLALTSTSLAQTPEITRGGPASPPMTQLSLNFSGGTMEQFVAALREATKDPVNIVLQGQATKIRVDAMKLRDVTVQAAVQAALEPRIGVTEMTQDGTVSTIMLRNVHPEDQGQPVFIVGVRSDPGAAARMGGGPMTEVFSIQQLLQASDGCPAIPEQVVLSAIDNGLKLTHAEGESKPEINYHKDSGLLLIRGDPGDLHIVKDVIGQMNDDHRRRGIEASQMKKNRIHNESEVQKMQVKMELAERRVELMRQRMAQVAQVVDKGSGSRTDLAEAAMAVEEAEAQCKLLKIEMSELAQQSQLWAPGIDPAAGPAEAPAEKPKAPASGKAKSKGE